MTTGSGISTTFISQTHTAAPNASSSFKTTAAPQASSNSSSFQNVVDKDVAQALKVHGIKASTSTPSYSTPQTIDVDDSIVALFHAFMASHEELLQGKLLPPSFEQGDLPEINKRDLEKMDIQYQMAMAGCSQSYQLYEEVRKERLQEYAARASYNL